MLIRVPVTIPFSRPYTAGAEADHLAAALKSPVWHGDGEYTARASRWLEDAIGSDKALLTTSCTHALELASMLLDLGPGDEVIVPSFTFSSTAAAIAVRGATPVFVDCTPDTLNLDPDAAARAVTDRTKAIYVVHYAGVAADMTALTTLADGAGLAIVEDNAHGLGAMLDGKPLGSFGAMATQSFHDTKNVTCGEGGALLVNRPELTERAEIIREKGTNRSRFLRGQVDKYTWVDIGSSFLPSDLLAALLVAQLESFELIQQLRQHIWHRYRRELAGWASDNGVTMMTVPDNCAQPAHMSYVLMPSHDDQTAILTYLRERGIVATFHYLPLDVSPAGQRFGRTPEPCDVTADVAYRLVRLPLFAGMSDAETDAVIEAVTSYTPL